jgi:hypothetical protein
MDEVREALDGMGLGQFGDSFQDEGYDNVKIIANLTHADAEELCAGVQMKKGHTKTFLSQYKARFGGSNATSEIKQQRLALRQYKKEKILRVSFGNLFYPQQNAVQ